MNSIRRAGLDSRTAEELMGFFVPGRAPVLGSPKKLPVALVHAHEEGHQKLCLTTTVGWYATVLGSLVQSLDVERQAEITREIGNIIQGSWATQEGYASLRQVAFLFKGGNTRAVPNFISALPASYQSALELFLCAGGGDLVALVDRTVRAGPEQLRGEFMVGFLLDLVGYVASRLAMSPPLAETFASAGKLPCPKVSAVIEASSADARLEKALAGIDEQFCREILIKCLAAIQIEVRRQPDLHDISAQMLDDALNELAQSLGTRTGMSYEPSFQIKAAPVVQRTLGLNIVEKDGRVIPLRAYTADVAVNLISPRNLADLPQESLEDLGGRLASFERLAAKGERFQWLKRTRKCVDAIVCEVLPTPEDRQFVALIYAYCKTDMLDRAMRAGGYDYPRPPKDSSIAVPVVIVRTQVSDQQLRNLAGQFECGAWRWIVGSPLLERVLPAFGREARAETVFLIGHEHAAQVDWKSFELTPSEHTTVADTLPIPQGLRLMVAALPDDRIRLFSTVLALKGSASGQKDFIHSCVADAIYRSLTARLFVPGRGG